MSEENKELMTISPPQVPSLTTPVESLAMIPELQKYVEGIAKSKAFTKNYTADKDGNVDPADIITAIMLGNEMGFAPMASVLLGNKLSINKYMSVVKGKALGIDSVTSVNKIYNIPTAKGDIIALAVDIHTKCLLDANVKFTLIEDFVPVYMYQSDKGNFTEKEVFNNDNTIKSEFYLIPSTYTDAVKLEIQEAVKNHKICILKKQIDTRTTWRFERPAKGIDLTISYTLQEATDADLYAGYHSKLTDIVRVQGKDTNQPRWMNGKDNWNNHYKTMLRNRPLEIGARIVVADKLQGTYSFAEAYEITDNEEIHKLAIEEIQEQE